MTIKLLLAIILVATPVRASAPIALFTGISTIHQVTCAEGKGTAFEAGGHMISVDHVTSLHGCFIDGKPVVATPEGNLDFSTIDLPANGMKVNCGGFKNNGIYWAIGYSWGRSVQQVIMLVGTGQKEESTGNAILIGYPTVIPGMSGGPIINSKGEAVGTINRYSPFFPLSMSRALKDTSLCKS